ncbi:hypothetical protein ACLQ24_02505 [Micromonospora sp. DT4]
MRREWAALPGTVVTEIAERVGGIIDVRAAATGNHAEIASTVVGTSGSRPFADGSGDRGPVHPVEQGQRGVR